MKQAFHDGYTAGKNNIHVARDYDNPTKEAILAWRDGWRVGFAEYQERMRAALFGEDVPVRKAAVEERRAEYLRRRAS